ncbi:uncharacterized protein LOC111703726 [Eurytemora carolleeae]|uniref:uncharacterized protein LOC111703726 n=1 Tax=Eurytemora carolleeae TaxID=1294199 RepID=UPI000C766C9A|nr:uncharacterized protein LOC111703726 [Eurytemora carolleeae]|eukprot:XP_023331531.1 uncharacterized protein LOC111703726 [Eurytemora affinis]
MKDCLKYFYYKILLDVGQETVVLSGLNKQAGDSLRHIKNLYDETKYLKAYLEKLEAKAHYDMVMRRAERHPPPWYRRILFICGLGGISIYAWYKLDPQGCENRLLQIGNSSRNVLQLAGEFFTRSESIQQNVIIS